MKIPTTTGTAGVMSLVPTVAPASTPATAGATSAIAPIVAIQPPSTDIHEVFGTADHVRELELEAVGQSGFHHILRDIARRVRRGAVDLRRVLAAERASAVPGVAAVRVHDDLAPRESGVSHRSADGERAGPVHEVLRLLEP